MITLTKTWSRPALRPIDDIPIVINTNNIIEKREDGFYIVNSSAGEEVKVSNLDFAIYSVLREQNELGTLKLTDDRLAALVCIHNGLITQAQLDDKVQQVFKCVQDMENGIIPTPIHRQRLVQTLFELGGATGVVSPNGKNMAYDLMSRELVIENIKSVGIYYKIQDAQMFIDSIWSSINTLVENKIILTKIHPIANVENAYFFPKKMRIARIAENTPKNEISNILSMIEDKYEDVLGVSKTRAHILHEKHPDDIIDFSQNSPISAGIALTQECQLRCRYCSFSSGDCGNNTLNKDSIRIFVDMLIKNVIKRRLITKKSEPLKIVIAGGGEPTYSWETFVETVEYIKQSCNEHKIKYNLEITTNGCHSKEQTKYIIDNFSKITLSFDGMPETQNKNRPFANGTSSFAVVNETIKRLDEAKANYHILSVVQPEDFPKIKEMAMFIFENYPNVRLWNVRPAVSIGRAATSSNYNNRHESYLLSYLDAVKSLGFPRKMFSGIFMPFPIEMFCGTLPGGNPWLIPGDKIVTCQDAQDDAVVMGHIINGEVVFEKNHDFYATKTFEVIKKCKNCLAYHFCGGDCPLQDNTPEMKKYSLWKCNEIYSYWQLALQNLIKMGAFDGWRLEYESLPELKNVDIYKMSSSYPFADVLEANVLCKTFLNFDSVI